MAITLGVTTVISNTSTVSSSSFNLNPVTAGVGRIITLGIVTDNLSTVNGQTNLHQSITDPNNNVWVKIREYTNAQGAAAGGVTSSLWVAKVDVEVAASVLTVTLSGAVTAKAAMGTSWNVTAGNSLQEAASQFSAITNTATIVNGPSLSGLPSKQYLLAATCGIEGPNGDTFTSTGANGSPTTGWGFTRVGTTGGNAATNITANMDYIVTTVTSAEAAPSNSVARDWSIILTALEEYTPAAFTPVDPLGMMGIFGI